jgi:hypothetical protein
VRGGGAFCARCGHGTGAPAQGQPAKLVEAFDKELNEVALQRESELQARGIGLYSDRLDSAGYPCREFTVHADPIVTGWQCRRECVSILP